MLQQWRGLFWAVLFVGITAVLSFPPPVHSPVSPPVPDLSTYPWVYLRDNSPFTLSEPVVEIIAVGDVMLGRDVAEVADPLQRVAPWLQTADLTIGNLESVIVASGLPRSAPVDEPQPIILNAPLTAVPILYNAGFDILSLANNHSLDYGGTGLAETAERLHTAGMKTIGAGPDLMAAYQPAIQEINGVKIAILAFNTILEPISSLPGEANGTHWWGRQPPNWQRADWEETAVMTVVSVAQAQADVVIVMWHGGQEYNQQVTAEQETAVQTLLAAGADVVIGHHPHVAQLVTTTPSGSLVAYSLGNFVFDQEREGTNQGLVLRLWVDGAGLRAAQLLPVWATGQPRLMTLQEAENLLVRILPPPPRTGFVCEIVACQPAEVPQTAESGLFWAGEIDLTGDGMAEQARRVGKQVIIYQAGTAVWQSPPEWQVLDVALGDPNNDGRYELLLAILKPDPDGYLRSHPYMVGYRGGEYKLLWGGRPAVDPIQEVALGDLDGDGAQELVVIEEKSDGSGQAVAVWDWEEWNFSLRWRSEYGHYQELLLLPGNRTKISVAVYP